MKNLINYSNIKYTKKNLTKIRQTNHDHKIFLKEVKSKELTIEGLDRELFQYENKADESIHIVDKHTGMSVFCSNDLEMLNKNISDRLKEAKIIFDKHEDITKLEIEFNQLLKDGKIEYI